MGIVLHTSNVYLPPCVLTLALPRYSTVTANKAECDRVAPLESGFQRTSRPYPVSPETRGWWGQVVVG